MKLSKFLKAIKQAKNRPGSSNSVGSEHRPLHDESTQQPSHGPGHKTSPLTVVGALPEPVGGISLFVFDLVRAFASDGWRVFDAYPAANKLDIVHVDSNALLATAGKSVTSDPQIEVFTRSSSKLFSLIWLRSLISAVSSGGSFFNFSTPRSLFLFGWLPKRASARWALTLYHGDLEIDLFASAQQSSPNSFTAKLRSLRRKMFFKYIDRSLQRFDRIIFVSDTQRDFYLRHGVDPENLIPGNPFVAAACVRPKGVTLPNQVLEFFEAASKAKQPVIVQAGSPTALYQHEMIFDIRESDSALSSAFVLCCLYGLDRESTLDSLLSRFEEAPNALAVQGLGPSEFLEVLALSDCLFRPTSTDSFGVACAQAVSLGTASAASSVCERFPGTVVFEPHDVEAAAQAIKDSMQNQGDHLEHVADWDRPMRELISWLCEQPLSN